MYTLPKYDMYDFIDDGVNKSFYTILSEYHPKLKRNFSLANLINGIPELEATPTQEIGYKKSYETYVLKLIKSLRENITNKDSVDFFGNELSEEEKNKLLNSLKSVGENDTECKAFTTINDFLDYAEKTISNPEKKKFRDVIINHAVKQMPQNEAYEMRSMLLKTFYLTKAEEKVRKVNHKSREFGEYPEWDVLQFIRQTLQKGSLKEYDEFYDEATTRIKEAALKTMEKERIAVICKRKRYNYVKKELNRSISSDENLAEIYPISEMFEENENSPKRYENSWKYESLSKPELICDLSANYSEDGIENQRVIAFRYGKLSSSKKSNSEPFVVDTSSGNSDLIGITRIGKDGARTYFVLMQPMDRMTFKPIGEIPNDPGDKLYNFTFTEDTKVSTRLGGTRIKSKTKLGEIFDGNTGRRLNAFINKDIPEDLKEFFAKVYFSDEYLSNAIKHNSRYIGYVVNSQNRPVVRTSDLEKTNLSAAQYAAVFPGIVDGRRVENFETFCTSGELSMKQYNLINDYENQRTSGSKKITDSYDSESR